ncbi:hypothetical protein FLONG3_568 [Fusarium longipes]|uniref:Uncharacterized protein n=1 Tax=Fusarium longipes TaxID=694270 RepID=A0A395T9R4_9HYPO|nr:hypothetical protein FLONG3_568 [Fusarium longipes]
MSDDAKPVLGSAIYIALDTEYESHGSSYLQSSTETSQAPSTVTNSFEDAWYNLRAAPRRLKQWQRVTSHTRSTAFKDAWCDIRAALHRFKIWLRVTPHTRSTMIAFEDAWHDLRATPHRLKIVKWRRLLLNFVVTVWSLSLLTLTICLAMSLPMRLDEHSPCHSDGNFHVSLSNTIEFESAFNYWAASGFFDVTLAWGRFDFSTVKLIDVAWDLNKTQIVGRGGQAIMALVSWRVFAEYLQVSLAATPATYTTVWLLRFQQSSSAFSTWQLATAFHKRGLASKTAMVFTILAAVFIMAFPTLVASMTGYTPKNEPYIVADNGRLNPLTDLVPAAYIIHDGDRVKGFTKEYGIPWKSGSPGRRSKFERFDYCDGQMTLDNDSDCKLQRHVSQFVMWTNAHRTLRLNNNGAPKQGWKALLEFAAAINLELKGVGIDPEVTKDKDLEHEIEQLLQGGSITSPQLTEEPFSTWCWIWKHKCIIAHHGNNLP